VYIEANGRCKAELAQRASRNGFISLCCSKIGDLVTSPEVKRDCAVLARISRVLPPKIDVNSLGIEVKRLRFTHLKVLSE
jgi:hypothetical protein